MTAIPAEPYATDVDASRVNDPDAAAIQIVSFRLGDECYAVKITDVQEIILRGQITELPHVPRYLRGLVNLRGHVIPVVDLGERFGVDPRPESDEARTLILNIDGRIFGVMVDMVHEVLRISEDRIESLTTDVASNHGSWYTGIIRVADQTIVLLNTEEIL